MYSLHFIPVGFHLNLHKAPFAEKNRSATGEKIWLLLSSVLPS